MIPKIIHHVWYGLPMIPQFEQWMETALVQHPDWKYIRWDETNTETLGLSNEQLRADHPKMMSDVIRIRALLDMGGVYMDSDVECLKPLDDLMNRRAFCATQDGRVICPAVFAAEPYHPWLQWIWDRIPEHRREVSAWPAFVMTDAPRDGVDVLPTDYFFPFLWNTPPERKCPKPDTYCLHHWMGLWAK